MDCPVRAFEACACVDRCKNVIDIRPAPNPFTFAARAWLVVAIISILGLGVIVGKAAMERQERAYQEASQ